MNYTTSFEAKVGGPFRGEQQAKAHTEPWQARFIEGLGFAVIFTSSKAIVWRLKHSGPSSDSSSTLNINLPTIPTKPKDPLPLGTLVHDSGVGDVALLVLQHNGDICYWESVTSAAHADTMRQKQQGLQGSIGRLFSGEMATEITSAEADGFLITTNAGRIIHLSVRDSQGKLAISTEVLRANNPVSGGLLSGIRSVFSSAGWRKDVAAAKCTSTRGKGHKKCVVVTKQCIFQTWDLARHTAKTLEAEFDGRQKLFDAISPQPESNANEELIALDFEFFPIKRKEQLGSQDLLLLCGLSKTNATRYFLVGITVYGGSLNVDYVRSIKCWDQAAESGRRLDDATPRLLLPQPAHTAFIVFDTSYIMASLTPVEEGPSSQLQRESDLLSEPFQDILFFDHDRDFRVIGCASQSPGPRSVSASCLLFVNNFGLAQASVTPIDDEEAPSVQRASLCRSKIEQAIFFGQLPTKLFDFDRSSAIFDWQTAEIEQAALVVNDTILDSTSKFISEVTPSMDQQLKDRSIALRELIKVTRQSNLSDLVRWQLLWSAEKMAAAKAVWQVYSLHLERRDEQKIFHNDENIVLLREAVDMISQKYKHEARPELGENDVVRHYFIKDIANIELLIPWAAHALGELYREGLQDPVKQALLVDQANDIQIKAMETAFKFREQNAEMYGFSQLLIQDGIYTGSYQNFPDVWTSCPETVKKTKDLAVLTRESALENGESSEDSPAILDLAVLTKMAQDASRLANLTCQVFEERLRTLRDRPGESNQSLAANLQKDYFSTRRELFSKLVEVELPEEGVKLAEKYEDVVALADVIVDSINVMVDRIDDPATPDDERAEYEAKIRMYENNINGYHEKYGLKWARAFYAKNMRQHSAFPTLKVDGPLTREFLQSEPDLLKIKWMYEIGSGEKYAAAARDLLKMNSSETNLWNKKVELSMAKLSLLAAKEVEQADDNTVQMSTKNANRRLTAIEVQEHLYAYTRPLLRTALDHMAETELAMDSFGAKLKKRKLMRESFRHSLEKLVRRQVVSEEELIDILTLMTCPSQMLDDDDFAGQRFFLALQVANYSMVEDESWTYLQRQIIWRRCILQDDWAAINKTEYKDDKAVVKAAEATALFKTLIAGYSDGMSILQI